MIKEILTDISPNYEIGFEINSNLRSFINQLNKEYIRFDTITCIHGRLEPFTLEYYTINHYLGENLIVIIYKDRYHPRQLHCSVRTHKELDNIKSVRPIHIMKWVEVIRDNKLKAILGM